MNAHLPACFFFVFLASSAVAQNVATISGQTLDQATSQPVPYASVVLKKRGDSTMTAGVLSDEAGRFTLAGVAQGEYVLAVSFVGYAPSEVPLLIGSLNRNFDVGKIQLMPQNTMLDEVTVRAQREIVSAALDKKSFNLDENISQSGSSVLDAMRNLPGIGVSPDGKILLRGSENVSVLIDGKPSSLTGFSNQRGLENLPASNIERIEIINNPSAKYQSAGMAGIVNIIYKKGTNTGLHGEAGLAIGVGELYQRRANLPNISPKYSQTPKLNPTLSLNYRASKLNWFLQADGIIRRRINANEFFTRNYGDTRTDVSSQFLENRTQKLYNVKGGIDWFITPRNTLTLFALWQDEYHTDRGDVPFDNARTGERLRLWTWAEDERTKFINYSANFNHKFAQPGHELSFSYLYTGGGEDEFFPFQDRSAVRNSFDNTFLTVYEYVNAFTADYVKPLRFGRIELGSRVALRRIPITYTLTPGENSILDPNIGAWSEYDENVYAVYGNFVRESKHLDIEAGLRFEPTFVTYTLDPNNKYYPTNQYQYLPLFPNVRFTFKLNEANTLSAFVNRRVDRPVEFDVRPFPKYDDPEILKTGNPNLRPQFTQTLEVAYKNYWKGGSVYVAAFHRMIDGIFSRIFVADNTSTVYSLIHAIPQNLGKGTNTGLEIAYQQTLGKWKFNGSWSGYRNVINAFSGTVAYPFSQPFSSLRNQNYTFNLKLNATAALSRQTDLQLTSVYYAPDVIPQGRVRSRYSLDAGLKKKLGATELTLAATDVLSTFQIRREITGNGFTLNASNYYETQVVTVGVKRKF